VTVEILDAQGKVVRAFLPDTARAGAAPNIASDSMRRAMRGGAGAAAAGGPDTARAEGGEQPAGGGRRGAAQNQAPPTRAGLNAVTWDLRSASATSFPGMILWGATTNGPVVPPGRYTVRLTADGRSVTQPVTVRRNTQYAATEADLQAQYALATQLRDKVSEANGAVVQIRDVKRQVADRLGKSQDAALKASGDRLTTSLSAVEEEIYQVRNQSGQDPLNFPIKVNNRLASLLGVVSQGDARPIAAAYPIFTDLKAELKVQIDRLGRVLSTELPAFNAELRRLGLEPVGAKPAPVTMQ